MKILFITQWFYPESGAIHGLPLAKRFKEMGHEVEVLTGFPNYPGGKIYPDYKMSLWMREVIDGVSVIRVPLYPSHNTRAISRIVNYLSFTLTSSLIGLFLCKKPHVVYVYHPPPTVGMAAIILKKLFNIPYVYHVADMWPESVTESGMVSSIKIKKIITSVINFWCSTMYRNASSITVLSPGFKRMLTERGVTEGKVKVIYNWADEDIFRPMPKNKELAVKLGINKTFNVLYAGNLGPFQGLVSVIEAAKLLANRPEICFIIVGSGHEEQILKKKVLEYDLANVKFLGRFNVTDMPEINALADIQLVHLRDLDFFRSTVPSKTQVCLASNRPTILAVAGDAADLMERSQGGLVCQPDNPEALADAVMKIYELTDTERDKMAHLGQLFYEENLSLQIGSQKLERLLASAVSITV
jgi:colanic acid biosynthesis glycosyl transferase WcaI